MSATANEKTMFRYEFGGDSDTMPDAWIDSLFTQAASDYAGYNRRVIVAAANLHACRQLANRAANKVDYSQNATSERLGQLSKAWKDREGSYEMALEKAKSDTAGSSTRVFRSRQRPPRRRQYPDS